MNKLVLYLILFLILTSCSEIKRPDVSKKYSINIEEDSILQEISFSIKDSIETIALEVYMNDLNRGIIQYRYKGQTSLQNQIPKLDTLFFTVFNNKKFDFDFTTIAWGRLSDSYNHDFTFAKRLALFAYKSDNWNKQSGRPVNGYINDFIHSLKNDFSIELGPLLTKYNYRIESVSAEKVLVYPAEKLAFWDQIKTKVNAKDKLPFDCQLWFKIRKI